jgi:hypothetical protein
MVALETVLVCHCSAVKGTAPLLFLDIDPMSPILSPTPELTIARENASNKVGERFFYLDGLQLKILI